MANRRDSRERIEAQIVELGRRHLVEHGAAGLSLRAIARDLGMVSSAVYRYVSSRDELLTLLLVDAYSDLADSVARARDSVAESGATTWSPSLMRPRLGRRPPGQLGTAVRQPVPGYHAPAERTVGPGTRVIGALFDAVAAGIATGDIKLTNYPAPQPISLTSNGCGKNSVFPVTIPSSPNVSRSGPVWWARSAWRCSGNTAPTR